MNVLAVSCYTGGEELCAMTEDMVRQLKHTVSSASIQISVTAQGAKRDVSHVRSSFPENHSFARGINTAIRMGSGMPCDYILVLNNDLQFPAKNWLEQLLVVARERTDRIIVPATDRAAIRVQPCAYEKKSFDVREMSAYCWLVPAAWSRFLLKTYGFEMFCEDFVPAYGEDNWTAYLLAKEYGPLAFRYVPRSWVKHLRHQTADRISHDRSKTSLILKKKFEKELSDPGLRGDLRLWAKQMVAVLK